jgi:hypothetical protein
MLERQVEEPQLSHPQPLVPLPPPLRMTTPLLPSPRTPNVGMYDPLPFALLSPLFSPHMRHTPVPSLMHSVHLPQPPLMQVAEFGLPMPAAQIGSPAPGPHLSLVVFPPPAPPPPPPPPPPQPVLPGRWQGGPLPFIQQHVPPHHGGHPMPPPPPPPGPPGSGPGWPFGGHPPQPPPQAAQPYYIYYPLPQHHEEGVRLKEPDVFTGKDPAKLPSFITQCAHWFMAKPRKFPTERDRVLFAASYLRDLANQWWMPLLTQAPQPPLLDDWATFTDELFQMFGNQHMQTTSQNAILDMKMKEEG